MKHLIILFISLFLLNNWGVSAQRDYGSYNKIGVSAGYLLANINTSDLPLNASQGFMFGFETRGSFSRYVDFIFGLTYYDAAMELETSLVSNPLQSTSPLEQTAMKLSSVQVQFLGSLNIIRHHLSVEIGPAVAVQGKFKPKDESDESRIVAGYDFLNVNDLREVSTIDFRGVVGLTAGFEPFRISAMYVYGFTNALNNLRMANTESSDLSGNTSYVVIRGIFYF